MDVSDQATAAEERERAAALSHRVATPVITEKRRRVNEARAIAEQRGINDPELADFSAACENCAEPLDLLNSDDIFCDADCASDWERRQQMNKIAGKK